MKNTFLIITSIADQNHPVLRQFAKETQKRGIEFITIGDSKSPRDFDLDGCDFYSLEKQQKLNFKLAKMLPEKHYSRKNLGYLIAASKAAEVIVETDDDNLPLEDFWNSPQRQVKAHLL